MVAAKCIAGTRNSHNVIPAEGGRRVGECYCRGAVQIVGGVESDAG